MNIDVTVKIKRCFSVWTSASSIECLCRMSEIRVQNSKHAPRFPLSALHASRDALRSTLHAPRAFTLIEVLVAMTVLSVLVLMAANIFQSSSASWNIGTQKADMNTAARAALDYMARELACAVAGQVEAASLATPANLPFNLSGGNEVQFVALSGDPEDGRALRGIRFKHENNTLRQERFTGDFKPYSGPIWGAGSSLQIMVTNVLSLTMVAFANESDLNGGAGTVPYNFNSLPLCLDIALEMLSDDDMRRYLATGKDPAFKARNAKLYSTRVYFPNRVGYQAR